MNQQENIPARLTQKDVAENLLGPITWNNETTGKYSCPGSHLHSGKAGDRDCLVHLDGVATIFCLHQSCTEEVSEANRQLRAALECEELAGVDRKLPAREIKEKQKEASKRLLLERRAHMSLSRILNDYRWTYNEILEDTKTEIPAHPEDHFHAIIGLFQPEDYVWIGEVHDSGSAEHSRNFRQALSWLEEKQACGPLTCPSAFKSTAFSRKNVEVIKRPFLVVESDCLSRDEVGAIFRFLRDVVGLKLRAVVDTAGKSLHAWFELPKKAILEQLEVILPQLGCDPGMFKQSQPCRMPGALRDGKYQRLIYLDTTKASRPTRLPSVSLPLPHVYYDGNAGCYWRENNQQDWQKINDASLDIELIARGYNPYPGEQTSLSEVKLAKRDIQITQDIVYAGPLAGYKSGSLTIQGSRILVTNSPHIIIPAEGEWNTIRVVLENLLGEDQKQLECFYGWIKFAYQSLCSGKFTPGQAMCLAGPANSGKSLVQALITLILGGRSAKPYQALSGKTNFNADHFAAEHLMIEDDVPCADYKKRRELSSGIKNITVSVTQSCHAKGRTPITLQPFWRLSITVNDEPENLMILPPMDESIMDKIILLKARQSKMPMPTGTPDQREEFMRVLKSEIPAFLYFLENWDITEAMKDERCGIKAYHHKELLEILKTCQEEESLLALIDHEIFPIDINEDQDNGLARPPIRRNSWRGTAESLIEVLTRQDSEVRHSAAKLLYSANTCGNLLGKLKKSHPTRISSSPGGGRTFWKIEAPKEGNNQ